MFTVEDAMKIFNVTEEDLDAKAKPYEDETFAIEGNNIVVGSHLDHVGKKSITVIYDAQDAQQINQIGEEDGVKPSQIYREALKLFLNVKQQKVKHEAVH